MTLLLIFLLLIPACKKTNIANEFNSLKKTANEITNADIIYDSYKKNPEFEKQISSNLSQGLSRNDAVRTALMNNPQLQAAFDMLGIAKADLIQAGLYTNPYTTNVFRFPTKDRGPGTAQMNIENELLFKFSDLWRVPLRTRIYEDELEIVTLDILNTILDIIEQTKMAYDLCKKTELQLENAHILFDYTQEYRDEVFYRQGFGYSNELDKDNANAQLAAAQVEIIKWEKERLKAYLHLTELLGISPTIQNISLTDSILGNTKIPDIAKIEYQALEYRPEIQIARYKVKRFEDTKRFERANAWKNVDIGVAYKMDFDKPFRGWGPAVNFEIPIFDTNFAQIAKADFELEQAQKKLRYQTIKIEEEVRSAYVEVEQELQEIQQYNESIIPALEHGVDYAYAMARIMQQNMLEAVRAQLNLYHAESVLIEKYYNLHLAYNKLERAYGKTFEASEINKETA